MTRPCAVVSPFDELARLGRRRVRLAERLRDLDVNLQEKRDELDALEMQHTQELAELIELDKQLLAAVPGPNPPLGLYGASLPFCSQPDPLEGASVAMP